MLARWRAGRRLGSRTGVLAAGIAVLLSLGLMAAQASDQSASNPVVVELYTSQGCSSCPPADAVLAQLASREDVIALALHVDYWDYLGWEDAFAIPEFATRQRAYARAAGQRMVYTPQMIVGGVEHLTGAHPGQLEALVDAHAIAASSVTLQLTRRDGGLEIHAAASEEVPLGAVLQLVLYDEIERVRIERGENAGRTIDYTNIVTQWREIGRWDGREPLSLRTDLGGTGPVAVILQAPGPGKIVAAARLR